MKKEILKELQVNYFPFSWSPVHEPNLSELIQACGYGFRNLILHTQYRKKLSQPWEAVPNKKLRPESKSTKGETPEIAVSKLWLELNKK